MSWLFNPSGWTNGVTIPFVADYQNIAADIQTAGANRDSGGYGIPNSSFLALNPGDLPGTTYTVSSAYWSFGFITVTLTGPHQIQVGQHVSIAGITPTGYNSSDAVVTTVASGIIVCALASNPGTWTSGGTVVVSGTAAANGMLAVDPNYVLRVYSPNGWLTPEAIPADGTVVLANGANENIAIGTNDVIMITGPTAGYSLGGFTGGVNGRKLWVCDVAGQVMTVNHEDSGSAAGNMLFIPTGAPFVCGSVFSTLLFIYSSPYWRLYAPAVS